jgi:hypothetical protein
VNIRSDSALILDEVALFLADNPKFLLKFKGIPIALGKIPSTSSFRRTKPMLFAAT